MLAKKVRGAAKVIVIDSLQYRLDHVSKHVPGVETINRKEHKVGTCLFLLADCRPVQPMSKLVSYYPLPIGAQSKYLLSKRLRVSRRCSASQQT